MPKPHTTFDPSGAEIDTDALYTQMWMQEWADMNERFMPDQDDPEVTNVA